MIVPGETWVICPYAGSVQIGKCVGRYPGPGGDDVLRIDFGLPGEFVLILNSLVYFEIGPGDGEDLEGWP